jgi:hypothetical protein
MRGYRLRQNRNIVRVPHHSISPSAKTFSLAAISRGDFPLDLPLGTREPVSRTILRCADANALWRRPRRQRQNLPRFGLPFRSN